MSGSRFTNPFLFPDSGGEPSVNPSDVPYFFTPPGWDWAPEATQKVGDSSNNQPFVAPALPRHIHDDITVSPKTIPRTIPLQSPSLSSQRPVISAHQQKAPSTPRKHAAAPRSIFDGDVSEVEKYFRSVPSKVTDTIATKFNHWFWINGRTGKPSHPPWDISPPKPDTYEDHQEARLRQILLKMQNEISKARSINTASPSTPQSPYMQSATRHFPPNQVIHSQPGTYQQHYVRTAPNAGQMTPLAQQAPPVAHVQYNTNSLPSLMKEFIPDAPTDESFVEMLVIDDDD